jgi:CHAT domain-containing protein/Tfp pilus assembly protein PilF
MRRSILRFSHASFDIYSIFLLHRHGRWVVHRGVTSMASLLFLAGMIVTASVPPKPSWIAQSARPAGDASNQAQNHRGDVLEPGKTIKRELSGSEVHSYQLTLAAGQFLRAVFDQQGINLIISIYGPDGRKIAEIDSPVGSQGPEPVSLIAEHSGNYRLEARAWLESAPRGRYEVRIEELRAATPRDKTRVAAERSFAEATLVSGQGTPESLQKAIEKYLETVQIWQTLGDPGQEAHTLTVIGYTHSRLAEYQKALDYYKRALPLSREAGDRSGEAMVLYNLGLVYNYLSDHQQALDFYNQALQIHRATGDRSMEAATLGNMGAVYSGLGEQQKALELFNQALPPKRAVGDSSGEATLLNNIGLVNSYLGEQQKALEFFNRALPILRAIGDSRGEATTLNNIASVYANFGDHRKALDFYDQVVNMKRAVGNRAEEAIALGNIGVSYANLGEHRKALEFYNQALPLSRASGARSIEAVTLNNIGKAHGNLGEHRKALEFYNQALSIQRTIGERRGIAVTLTNIGRAHHDLGEQQKALEFFNQALSLRRAVRDPSGEAITLYNLARVQLDLNNLAGARTQIEAAFAIIESLRTKVASQGLRASYLASIQKYYELGVEILMRLHKERPSEGFDAAALQTSERSRARTLLELLAEARAEIRQGVSPALLEREHSLQRLLDTKAVAQMRLLGGKHTPEQAAVAAKEIDALTTEYEQVQAQIRHTSPRYAALTQPVPLSLKEIQTEVLDDGTMLLMYALGEKKSYLWAVTPTTINSFELPKRSEIEASARRVYELLSARNQSAPNETLEQKQQRLNQADAEYPKAAAALSRMLLSSVVSQLGSKRLLIVGESMLQYVPFAALPVPVAGGQWSVISEKKSAAGKQSSQPVDGGRWPVAGDKKSTRGKQSPANSGKTSPNRPPTTDYRPLILEHEVVSLPSASVMAVLRRETAGRKPAVKTIAVLADPVFRREDPRIGPPGKGQAEVVEGAPIAADVYRSATESGLADFVRLRFSRQEAEQITRHTSTGKKLKALDFDASRATATSEELGQYTIVHFATHGLINNQHPELSGIVLSMVNKEGQPQDGFLRLHEIYNLRLGADLVVLSACQTALGKEIKGEGLIGLTRGFMYAGAPRVVASLWRIDDRASAELMKRFYEEMLGGGQRPAAALRAAQISMWKQKRWESPHYWASFTLQGEWK